MQEWVGRRLCRVGDDGMHAGMFAETDGSGDRGTRRGRNEGHSLSPIFTALHRDPRSPQFVREEVYHVVVPEELNLLDFSNVDVHINVMHMVCFWLEGPPANIDRESPISRIDEYRGCPHPAVPPNSGCGCWLSAIPLKASVHIRGR